MQMLNRIHIFGLMIFILLTAGCNADVTPSIGLSVQTDSAPKGVGSGFVDDQNVLGTAEQTDMESAPKNKTENDRNEPEQPKNVYDERMGTMKMIRVSSGGKEIVYALNSSNAADALVAQLPMTIQVENYSTNEKIFYPEKLDTKNTPLAKAPVAGTLAYYGPWGDVVLFYGSFRSAPGLYELGTAVSGVEHIASLSGSITIETFTQE